MNCHQVQSNLSLYLYGELDFAQEEALEEHLSSCAFCELAVAREKSWHAALHSEGASAPLDLLSECRQELRTAIAKSSARSPGKERRPFGFFRGWRDAFPTIAAAWPARAMAASFLLSVGFWAGHWMGGNRGWNGYPHFAQPIQMGVLQPYTHVRDVRPGESGRIRIVVDEGREGELTGSITDDRVKQLLLTATQDPEDPAVRVYSVEMLSGQTGSDVRDALLASVRSDPNAAVRLKAVEALRPFLADPLTRHALLEVLRSDSNPGVRSEAINLLLPSAGHTNLNRDTITALEQIAISDQSDDYVRFRCVQILRAVNNPLDTDYPLDTY